MLNVTPVDLLKVCYLSNTVSRFWKRSPRWHQWTSPSSADGSWRTTPIASSSCPPAAPGSSLSPSPRWPAVPSSHWWRWRVLLQLWGGVVGSWARPHRSQVSVHLPPRALSRKSTPRRCGSILCWFRPGREWARSGPELFDNVSDCLLSLEGAIYDKKGRKDT